MLVSPTDLQQLITDAEQVFVLVKLNTEVSVYLNITKVAIQEYLTSLDTSDFLINLEFGENNELLLGYSQST